MPKATVFIGWGATIPGREQKALQVFNESVQYWGQLQQAGRIDRFETYQLDVHGGDLAGFALLHGESEALSRLRTDDEFIRYTVRANLVVQNLGVVGAVGGEEMMQQFALFQQQLAELT